MKQIMLICLFHLIFNMETNWNQYSFNFIKKYDNKPWNWYFSFIYSIH